MRGLTFVPLLALSAAAVPFNGHAHQHLHSRQRELDARRNPDTFEINLTNSCSDSKSFAIYQITDDFAMNQISDPVSVDSGATTTIHAPYNGIGMRLSGTADQGTAAQWAPQALFEFGYSTFGSVEGTAYDLSLMAGSAPGIGLSVVPANSACPSKTCLSTSCAADQGWTSASQVDIGSPADTVCYQGKTNFAVTWCAS